MKVLGIILLVLVLLMLMRVGCRVDYSAHGFYLWLKIAWFRIKLLPRKPLTAEQQAAKDKKEADKKAKKRADKAAKEKAVEEAKARGESIPKKKPGDLVWLLEFLNPVFHGLNQLRRKLRIDHMTIMYRIGGAKDPALAAQRYGQVSAGGGALFPLLNATLDVRGWDVDLGIDFSEEKTLVAVSANATYRLGHLLVIVIALAFRALRIYLNHKKETKTKEEANHAGQASNR